MDVIVGSYNQKEGWFTFERPRGVGSRGTRWTRGIMRKKRQGKGQKGAADADGLTVSEKTTNRERPRKCGPGQKSKDIETTLRTGK